LQLSNHHLIPCHIFKYNTVIPKILCNSLCSLTPEVQCLTYHQNHVRCGLADEKTLLEWKWFETHILSYSFFQIWELLPFNCFVNQLYHKTQIICKKRGDFNFTLESDLGRVISADIGWEFSPFCLVWWALFVWLEHNNEDNCIVSFFQIWELLPFVHHFIFVLHKILGITVLYLKMWHGIKWWFDSCKLRLLATP
jgi:hypothetical protein